MHYSSLQNLETFHHCVVIFFFRSNTRLQPTIQLLIYDFNCSQDIPGRAPTATAAADARLASSDLEPQLQGFPDGLPHMQVCVCVCMRAHVCVNVHVCVSVASSDLEPQLQGFPDGRPHMQIGSVYVHVCVCARVSVFVLVQALASSHAISVALICSHQLCPTLFASNHRVWEDHRTLMGLQA